MAQPYMYCSEAFREQGRWWRQGKLGPYLVWDELDTTRPFHGTTSGDLRCWACRAGIEHSRRHHNQTVVETRKSIICHPRRDALLAWSDND